MKEFGVNHRKVTSYHLEVYGEAERFNKNFKKIDPSCYYCWSKLANRQNCLLSSRTNPLTPTGVAPAKYCLNATFEINYPVKFHHLTNLVMQIPT